MTDSITYFQFQFPLLVCFYTVVEVKWLYRFKTFIKE